MKHETEEDPPCPECNGVGAKYSRDRELAKRLDPQAVHVLDCDNRPYWSIECKNCSYCNHPKRGAKVWI